MAARVNMVRTGPRGGCPVVLVHPVGFELSFWSEQIDALRERFDVVAYDLPGHGLSQGSPADCTEENEAATLGAVIDATGAAQAHVVGISMGGFIAQAFAVREPERCRSLVLMGTAATFSAEARKALHARAGTARSQGMQGMVQASMERWFTKDTRTNRPHVPDRATKTLLQNDAAIHAALWEMLVGFDTTAELHRITCPTLVLVGESDPSTPVAAAADLAGRIQGAQLRVVPEASHLVPLERSAVVNAELLQFLPGVQ